MNDRNLRKRPAQAALSRDERFANAITALAEAFQVKQTVSLISAYEIGTRDLPIELIESAAAAAICGCKWMPKVFELRQLAGANGSNLPVEERALIAWTVVRGSISRVGGYRSINFDDPITNATIRALGGWVRICDSPPGKDLDTWLQKEFVAVYCAKMAAGVEAQETIALSGIDAATRSLGGYDPAGAVAVRVGLPEIPSKLIRGVIREPVRLVDRSAEVANLAKSLELPKLDGPRSATIRRMEAADRARIPLDPKAEAAAKAEAIERLKQLEKSGRVTAIRDRSEKPFIEKGSKSGES